MHTYDHERTELLNRLRPWWRANGWNPKTLETMSIRQLQAIYIKARGHDWPVTPRSQRLGGRRRQLSLF